MNKQIPRYRRVMEILKKDLGWDWTKDEVTVRDSNRCEVLYSLLKPECKGQLMLIELSEDDESDFLVFFGKNGQISLGDKNDHWLLLIHHLADLGVSDETLRAIKEIP